jgi:GrpB-like predicted nucleotidyltransferase (UPF0157 family)
MNNSSIGLQRGTVVLQSHHSTWNEAFEVEKAQLASVLGNRPIEHVGSTAIAGLDAKPIIDIAVAVESLAAADKLAQSLAALGYEYKGEAGTPGRRFFVKGPEAKRTFYLHCGLPDGEFGTLIKFRDTLRARPDRVAQYNELKRALAAKFADDRKAYTRGKADFIQNVLGNS